jgi:hypothetical protein
VSANRAWSLADFASQLVRDFKIEKNYETLILGRLRGIVKVPFVRFSGLGDMCLERFNLIFAGRVVNLAFFGSTASSNL